MSIGFLPNINTSNINYSFNDNIHSPNIKRRKVDNYLEVSSPYKSNIIDVNNSSYIKSLNDSDLSYLSPIPIKIKEMNGPLTPFLNRSRLDYLYDSSPQRLCSNANPFTTPYRKRPSDVISSPKIIPLKNNQSRYTSEFQENCMLCSSRFGGVYKCEKRFDGISYAVKHIYTTLPDVESCYIIDRVQMLSKMTGRGDMNKHIVKYYNSWCEEKILYIQMELCDFSLDRRIKTTLFSEKEILRFFKHVIKGILHLRSQNYYCYRIEPSNIYIHHNIYKIGVLDTHVYFYYFIGNI